MLRSWARRIGQLPAWGLLAWLLPVVVVAAAPAEPPAFAVSATSLGVVGGTLAAAEFVGVLNAAGWCRATEAPAARAWHERPAKVPPGEWVSVVLAGFGEQAEAFAFMADRPNGGLRLVGHVSYRKTWTLGGTLVWIPPTGRLAAAFRAAYLRPAGGDGEAVGFTVAEWPRVAGTGEAPSMGGAAVGLDEMTTEVGTAPTVTLDAGGPALEVMLCGALCQNGWTPTRTRADGGFALAVRFGFRTGSWRLTRTGGGGAPAVRHKLEMPEALYYATLRRLLQQYREPGLADFFWLGATPAAALAATPERLCVQADDELVAYDPRHGRRVWPEPPQDPAAKRPALPPYAVRATAAGVATVYLLAKGVAALDLETGSPRPLATLAPATPETFAVRDDGLLAVVTASALAAFRDGAPLWRRDDLGGLGAPLVLADRIVATRADGAVVCVAAADGRDVWRVTTREAWGGELLGAGGQVIGFSRDPAELVALNAADGTLAWRQPLGDTFLKTPMALGERVLAVGKNHRLLVLDPATGKPVVETVWPTWLVDVQVLPGPPPRIACTDIGGRYTELAAATLKPLRTLVMPARPAGRMLVVPRFPLAWAAAQTATAGLEGLFSGKIGPAVLVPDAEGFCGLIWDKQE